MRKATGGLANLGEQVVDAAAKLVDRVKETADKVLGGSHPARVHVPDYLGYLRTALEQFAEACRSLTKVHFEELSFTAGLDTLARFS